MCVCVYVHVVTAIRDSTLAGVVRESSTVTDAWPTNCQERPTSATGPEATEMVTVCWLMEKGWRPGSFENKLQLFQHACVFMCVTSYNRCRLYLGMWKRDQFHGPGILLEEGEEVFEGCFENGQKMVSVD